MAQRPKTWSRWAPEHVATALVLRDSSGAPGWRAETSRRLGRHPKAVDEAARHFPPDYMALWRSERFDAERNRIAAADEAREAAIAAAIEALAAGIAEGSERRRRAARARELVGSIEAAKAELARLAELGVPVPTKLGAPPTPPPKTPPPPPPPGRIPPIPATIATSPEPHVLWVSGEARRGLDEAYADDDALAVAAVACPDGQVAADEAGRLASLAAAKRWQGTVVILDSTEHHALWTSSEPEPSPEPSKNWC